MALAGADGVNTVSRPLAMHLRQSGQLDDSIPVSIIGGCVDTERFLFDPARRRTQRQQLGFNDRFVVCYCGGMWHWQRPEAVAQAFAAIRSDMPDAHMLLLSRQSGAFLEHLQRAGVPEGAVTCRSATHEHVPDYLMAADVGLLLREDHLINRTAAPVKFAEYLRCGLPVILTPHIVDFSELALSEDVGGIVPFPVRAKETIEVARELRCRLETEGDAYRNRCSRLSRERLSWRGRIGELIRLYAVLSSTQGPQRR